MNYERFCYELDMRFAKLFYQLVSDRRWWSELGMDWDDFEKQVEAAKNRYFIDKEFPIDSARLSS